MGPSMGAPLQVFAIVVRILSQLWKKPIVGVNHYVAHIEMERIVTGVDDPIVFIVCACVPHSPPSPNCKTIIVRKANSGGKDAKQVAIYALYFNTWNRTDDATKGSCICS
ncbi:hypothetical protein IFM89_001109 [Coptis chinensis]|uniref:Gcp-like domain-containing protein n=1 Tax=Coptis chinensis TaxID=261450 RepID=A0A835MC65_9MAGN|nr:hypothetical protein IFM89_001109 [Coptis chinensis]